MSDFEILNIAERIKKCETKKKSWESELTALRAMLSHEMFLRGAESITVGRYAIRKSTYTREQIDAKALREKAPETYAIYCKPVEVTTVSVSKVNV